MTTVILCNFVASKAYKTDPKVITEGMKSMSSIDGVIANYYGLLMEDNNVGYTIQVATSPGVFADARANKKLYDKICDQMAVGRVGGFNQCHFVAVSDPIRALTSPVIELAHWTLKDPTAKNKQAVDNILRGMNKESGGRCVYGWTREDPSTFIVLAAWDSKEAHRERAGRPDAMAAIAKLLELADPHGGPFRHVKLTKFQEHPPAPVKYGHNHFGI